ncbi:MAG: hypothetical protein GY796_22670 [Chloroflexi bacterium]|nr:hypothetical protein [Chloroflexota bacterium]
MRRRQSDRPRPPEFKIGIVRRYAVHVYKKDLSKWEQKGFVNSGGRPAIVPMPPDKVWVWGIPQTLVDVGIERLIGRKVDGFSSSLGTYGMGGHGFWGMRLEPGKDAGFGEYLVLPISSGSRFVRINGFRSKSDYYEMLSGSLIDHVKLVERRCDLRLRQKSDSHLLTLYLDAPTSEDLHHHPQDYEEGQIADYLIFQDRRGMLTS